MGSISDTAKTLIRTYFQDKARQDAIEAMQKHSPLLAECARRDPRILDELEAVIVQATHQEREDCARAAERMDDSPHSGKTLYAYGRMDAAAAIRARKD